LSAPAATPIAATDRAAGLEPLIPAARIRRRVSALAREIDVDYRGRSLTLVVVLKGGAIFAADLMRQLTIPVAVEFITASSYAREVRSSGSVRVATPETLDLAGRDVLVIEDIIDSGLTYRRLMETLARFAPASLALCSLLRKQVGRPTVDVRYVGFEIPNSFVVGYGMDYAERYRNLPDISVLTLPSE
jgi:hypoxanthine phosphoribosyltransferase